ncbi:transmembrane protein, putative (macronuclear) [Tetrahymena thermophila SB210]|uniref:Transmembrane protein, putative n=1 Tax=Tetrahymena thermophila (strain SB210) TaxID=312017 RepID=W7XKQ7_TETTS|nr:transmembrane protein, putative [Tetrahymena thermophila SB210]EWS76731.1 transmembrane protein, putative [Tetrahymena thermophila SB210]|eukprot:XP_012650724.1 transmembrane protein, putative [Tetrahymena thermophila SB210]
MSKKLQTKLKGHQSKIYQIDGEANNQEDLQFLHEIENDDNNTIEKEVDNFLDTYFERQKFMKEIDLEKLNQVFEPIINHIQNIITSFNKRDDAPSFNQYFSQQDQGDKIVLKPLLNDFDLFAQKIQTGAYDIEQRNADQVVIEINNQYPNKKPEQKQQIQKSLDPLNKQQIQSIKKIGQFTVFKEKGTEIWGVLDSFYISQQSLKNSYQQSIQKYTQDIKEQFLDSECTWKRYWTNNWENSQFSKQYINLLDSLITFYHIPLHLLNAIIGIPLKRVEFQKVSRLTYVNEMINKSTIKREPQNYDQLIQNLLKNMNDDLNQVNFQLRVILQHLVVNLQWNKQLYQEVQYLKLSLLLKTYEQYFNEVSGDFGQQEKFQQFLREFKAFYIVKYFKSRIRNEITINQNSVCDCIYFIKQHNLPQGYENQYLKIFQILNESQNFKPKKQEIIYYYNNNNIDRSTYFWKLIYYWNNFKIYLMEMDSVYDAIVNGAFGLVVFFSCKKEAHSKVVVSGVIYDDYHKTLSQMFREIKQQIEQNSKKFKNSAENLEDENDDDGVFGDCCGRFNCGFYIRNYFCLYFLKGIVFINILLRLVSIVYVLFLSLAFFLAYFVILFFVLFQMICALFVFDFSNPRSEKEEFDLVYPTFFPVLQIPTFESKKFLYSAIYQNFWLSS